MKSVDFPAGNPHKSEDFIKDFMDFTDLWKSEGFMDKSEELIVGRGF